MSHTLLRRVLIAAAPLAMALCQTSVGQQLPDAPEGKADVRDAATLANTPRNILKDQEAIWTSPAHLNGSNAVGPITLVVATAALATTDHHVMSSSRLIDTSLNNHAETASNGLVGAFIVAPVAFYGLGHLRHDSHAAETGILGGEAILDSIGVNEIFKIVSLRERPTTGNAKGKFFQTSVGFNSSFPSNHSIIAWSSAAVAASEYPGVLNDIAFYGLATGVSVTRVLARQHFPSDVLVGSAVGWMIGRYVFHHHQRSIDFGY